MVKPAPLALLVLGVLTLPWSLPAVCGQVVAHSNVFVGVEPQPHSYGPLTLTMASPRNSLAPHGYVEYRVSAKNNSAEPHRVKIVMPKDDTGKGVFLSSITRTFDVGPASQVTVSLFQPDLNMASSGVNVISVIIDGRPQDAPLASAPMRQQFINQSGSFSCLGTVLVSAQQLDNGIQLHWNKPKFFARTHTGSMTGFQFFLMADGDSGSTNWLGYSAYDGVVLSAAELAAKGPKVEAALRQYVECGGSLVVVGSWKAPPAWQRTRQSGQGVTRFHPGFGTCLNIEEPKARGWSINQLQWVASSWQDTGEPWMDPHTPAEANKLFPVVEGLNVPVRGMFVLMLVFSVVIGPVNLYVLARKKRRIWLLWTVPVISLVTCLTVLGYMVAAEGWEGHVRSETITVLDEPSQQATTLGWIGFYTPIVPSDGLHFSQQTELTPQVRNSGARSHPYTMDWTPDQHLTSGWLTARVPAQFMVRKSERRPEQVTINKTRDGTRTIVNGLKADIRSIRFMSTGCIVYAADTVPAGQEAILRPVGSRGYVTNNLRELYRGQWLNGIRNAAERPESLLQPGCYVAVLDASPFLEAGLARPGHRKGLSVVIGVMKEPLQD